MKPILLILTVTALALTTFVNAAEASTKEIALRYVEVSDVPGLVAGVLGSSAASAIMSVDTHRNSLQLDATNPRALEVRELIAKVDRRIQAQP